MLIFHEGLPGSGKSYEALISHIIPSIQKGRKVFARINGLNYEKIAELTGREEAEVKALLVHITEEQVHDIHEHVENDSMVIIDELQNFWPTGRGKLSDGITQFVTEHRHRGLDIVAMGQSIADVHNLWRRRTQRKIQFLKLDMVGADNRYKWTAFQGSLNAKGDVQFTKIKSGTRKYEKKYFGSYASHQANTDNTDNYSDDRLNIFKTKSFTVALPAFGAIVIFAFYYLNSFFSPQTETETKAQEQQVTAERPPAGEPNRPAPQEPEKPKEHGFNFVSENNGKYESKITYLDVRKYTVLDMIVVWYDETGRVIDRLTYQDFRSMGYDVKYEGYGVKIEKPDYKALFRFKPKWEPAYGISENHREQLHTTSI